MHHTRLIFNAVLLSCVLAVADSASCNKTFSGLTTCAVLNGMSHNLEEYAVSTTIGTIEKSIRDSYAPAALIFVMSDSCKAKMYNTTCISVATHFGLSTSTCEPIKLCYESCVDFVSTCMVNVTDDQLRKECMSSYIAPNGTYCYSMNEKHVMKSMTTTTTPAASTTTPAATSTTTPPPILLPPPPPPPAASAASRGQSWTAWTSVAAVLAFIV